MNQIQKHLIYTKKNIVNKKNIQIHNVGVWSKDEELNFFYVKWKSWQWSVYEENSKEWLLSSDTIKTKIKIICFNEKNLESYGIEKYYDFIKIDVEWFELDVLQWLKNIWFRYLYMELSVDRIWSNLEDVKELLNKNYYKDVYVLYLWKNKWTTRDVIFELI